MKEWWQEKNHITASATNYSYLIFKTYSLLVMVGAADYQSSITKNRVEEKSYSFR